MSFPALELQDPEPEILQLYDENIVQWADEEIAESMRAVARAANMSQHYIDSIKVIKTGFATVKIINIHEHASKLEFGTRPHKITTKGGPNARNPPRKLKFPGQTGAIKGFIFAPEVDHPGTRPMLIMTKGWEIGVPLFKQRAIREAEKFRESKS